MKSTLRHARLNASLPTSISPRYVCLRCRTHRLLSHFARTSPTRSLLPLITQRHASDDSDQKSATDRLAEGLRKKVWGTDTPPGPRDPYKPLTPEEREKQEEERLIAQEEEVQKQAESNATAEAVTTAGGGYVPATTWDGLEMIGGAEGWWEEAWDRENQFEGFLTGPKIEHERAEATVRRVLIEVLTFHEENRPLSQSSEAPIDSDVNYDDIDIVVSADGQCHLSFKDPALQWDLLKALQLGEIDPSDYAPEELEHTEEGNASISLDSVADHQARMVQKSAEEIQTLRTQVEGELQARGQTLDKPWHTVSLNDLEFKFAFVKRLMQLSGIRIPDPKINQFTTIGDVVAHLAEKPQPKKLAELLLSNQELMALPNVEVFERRHTSIDKEKEVGRWKLIEDELVRRGLPVTGTLVN